MKFYCSLILLMLVASGCVTDARVTQPLPFENAQRRAIKAFENRDLGSALAHANEALHQSRSNGYTRGVKIARLTRANILLSLQRFREAIEELDHLERRLEPSEQTLYLRWALQKSRLLIIQDSPGASGFIERFLPDFNTADMPEGQIDETVVSLIANRAKLAVEDHELDATRWIKRFENSLNDLLNTGDGKRQHGLQALRYRLLASTAPSPDQKGSLLDQAINAYRQARLSEGLAATLLAKANWMEQRQNGQQASNDLRRQALYIATSAGHCLLARQAALALGGALDTPEPGILEALPPPHLNFCG